MPKIILPYLFIALVSLLINFDDFLFYSTGFSLFLLFLTALLSGFFLFLNKQYSDFRVCLVSIFFLILLIVQYVTAYYFTDSVMFILIIYSTVIIFLFLKDLPQKQKEKIVFGVYLILLVNLLFSLTEFFLKKFGVFDTTIVKNIFYITDNKSIIGLIYQSNFNALLLNSGLILTIYFSYKNEKLSNIKTLYLYYILCITFIYMSAATGSRAALVALSLSFLVIYIFLKLNNFDIAYYKHAFISFLLYFPAMYINGVSAVTKNIDQAVTGNINVYSRFNIWLSQLMMFRDNFLAGVGFDNFKYLNNPYQLKAVDALMLSQDNIQNFTMGHNEILQLLAEGGLLFFVPFIVCVYFLGKNLYKNVNINNIFVIAVTLLFVIQAMFSWPLRHPFILLIFVFLISALYTPTSKNNIKVPKKYFYSMPTVIMLIILFVLTMNVGRILITEYNYINKAKQAETIEDRIENLNKIYDSSIFTRWSTGSFISQTGFEYLNKRFFVNNTFPLTKETYNIFKEHKFDYERYDKLINSLIEKTEMLENLHKIWIHKKRLAFFYFVKGDYEKSASLAKAGVLLNPDDDYVRALWHLANVHRHAETTGRPLVDFLPSKEDVENLMDKMQESKQEVESIMSK